MTESHIILRINFLISLIRDSTALIVTRAGVQQERLIDYRFISKTIMQRSTTKQVILNRNLIQICLKN
jgi:hypothetical protein